MRLCPALAGALALFSVPIAAQEVVLPYLPKDTMMAVSVPDLPTSMAEFGSMPLAKMWAEEEVQSFLADVMAMAKKEIDKAMAQAKEMHQQGALPVSPDDLMKLRVRGGTFAITSMQLEMGDFGPMPKFGMVLHLDFGDTAEQWFGLARLGMSMMEQQARDEMQKEETTVGAYKLTSYTPKSAMGIEMGLNVAMTKTGIVLGTLKDDVRGVLDNMQKQTPVLAATPRFQANSKHLVADGAEYRMFMRLDPMLDFTMSALRLGAEQSDELKMVDMDGVERAIEALGLRCIQSIGSAGTYQNGKAVSKGYTVAPAPDRKGVFAGANKNLDVGFLKWVPNDAVSFSGATMDPLSLYDAMVNALRAYDSKFAEQMLEQLGGMEKQLGFTIRDDLFGSLGDTWCTWSMPMGNITSAPEMAFLVKVKDQDKIVKVLKNLAALTDGAVEIEEGEKRGLKAYQVRVNADPLQGMGVNLFDIINPTFAFKNGYMVAGFSASDVKRVFQRMDREDDPKGDIRGNKEYAAIAAQLPAEVQSVSFTDWKANFESLYQIATGVLAFLPMGEDVPIDMSRLPDSATLTKHLSGEIAWSKADGNGFATTSVGPFGPELTLGLVTAIAVGAGLAATVGRRF